MAQHLILETADYLARGIEQVAHTIDPEAILLGGAMTFGGAASKIGQMFLRRIQTQTQTAVFPEIYRGLKIAFAQLGSDAGYIGAAGLARVRWRAGLAPSSAESLAG